MVPLITDGKDKITASIAYLDSNRAKAIRFLRILRGCGGVQSPPDLPARLVDADFANLSWLHRLLGHETILKSAIIAGYVRGSDAGAWGEYRAGRAYAFTNAAPDWLRGETS